MHSSKASHLFNQNEDPPPITPTLRDKSKSKKIEKDSHTGGSFSRYYDHQPWVPLPLSNQRLKITPKKEVRRKEKTSKRRIGYNLFPTKKLSFPFRRGLSRNLGRQARKSSWHPSKMKSRSTKNILVNLPNLPGTKQTHDRLVRRKGNILSAVPREGKATLFALSVIGSLLAL